MPRSNRDKQVVMRASYEEERIDKALFLMATRLGKTLTAERINLWHEDLASYPVEAIEYASDCWGRNAKSLPVPADFTGLLKSWSIPDSRKPDNPGCRNCEQGWVIMNPDDKPSDYKMTPCECLSRSELRQKKHHPPLSPAELQDLRQRISDLDACCKISSTRFANGNPRFNRELVQARALSMPTWSFDASEEAFR